MSHWIYETLFVNEVTCSTRTNIWKITVEYKLWYLLTLTGKMNNQNAQVEEAHWMHTVKCTWFLQTILSYLKPKNKNYFKPISPLHNSWGNIYMTTRNSTYKTDGQPLMRCLTYEISLEICGTVPKNKQKYYDVNNMRKTIDFVNYAKA